MIRYRPVTIERRWFHKPLTTTSNTWIATKPTNSQATMKCTARAACRPPNTSTQPGSRELSHGDIAHPASTIKGSSTKMTAR